MSNGWSPSDKAIAKKVAIKAKAAAEAEVIHLHGEMKIVRIEDLWALELQIREWRRERRHAFITNYGTAEQSIAEWIRKGWISLKDVSGFSESRLDRIRIDSKQSRHPDQRG